MLEKNGQCNEPFLVLHGGAGPRDPAGPEVNRVSKKLIAIGRVGADLLARGKPKLALAKVIEMMEEDGDFNAGYGSAIQNDGAIRVTAAYMDSIKGRFSGVINCQGILFPSRLAHGLQDAEYRVLAQPGNQIMAEKYKMDIVSLASPERTRLFNAGKAKPEACDTVGCVLWHPDWGMAASTSTGGIGFETPGRVSDAATVAGTYSSEFAAVSATGRGEEIVDDAFAARLETRVRDGLDLASAAHRCFREAMTKGSRYGWIAVDGKGRWNVSHTTPAMIFAVCSASGQILLSSLAEGDPV